MSARLYLNTGERTPVFTIPCYGSTRCYHSNDIDKCLLTSLSHLPVSALTCGDHGWPPVSGEEGREMKLNHKGRGGVFVKIKFLLNDTLITNPRQNLHLINEILTTR